MENALKIKIKPLPFTVSLPTVIYGNLPITGAAVNQKGGKTACILIIISKLPICPPPSVSGTTIIDSTVCYILSGCGIVSPMIGLLITSLHWLWLLVL